jgi:hypothetical protein
MADIDYRARPSKAVQRQMIVDACRRLAGFAPLKDYQYVGFGGLEFVDFDLMHRALGITSMTSIESNTMAIDRYAFNAPFNGINLLGGNASNHLADLNWAPLSVVWLDYEQRLNDEVISDVSLLCGRLQPGSVLIVSVNAQPERKLDSRREGLVKLIGEDRVPSNVTNESLAKWGLSEVQHRVLTDIIVAGLRNRPVPAEWGQILDVHYADGAMMQTLAGVILAPGNRRTFDSCHFRDLDFTRMAGEEALHVRVPILTAKERRAVEEQLPLQKGETLNAPWLPVQDREAYLQVYRYCTLDRLQA